MDVGKSPSIPYVYVGHHGEVQNYKPLQVMTACSLDIYNFPFDVQNCSLTFTSWLHTSEYCTWAPGGGGARRGVGVSPEHLQEEHPLGGSLLYPHHFLHGPPCLPLLSPLVAWRVR